MKYGLLNGGFRRLAAYDDWYYAWSSEYSLQDILDRWAQNSQKLTSNGPFMYPLDEVWEIREYTWSEENARRTPEEYQELRESMSERGWDPNDPALVQMGKNGIMKIGEGNHRLAIAQELGITEIPIMIDFYQHVTISQQPEQTPEELIELEPESIQEEPVNKPKRELSPEEQEQVDELMDLLFSKW